MADKAFEVTAPEFSALLAGERPVLVDFSANWCGPCKAMLPVVERLATRFAGQAEVVKVDIDNSRDLAGAFGVRSVPTFLLFVGGQDVGRITGLSSEKALSALIEPHLSLTQTEPNPTHAPGL